MPRHHTGAASAALAILSAGSSVLAQSATQLWNFTSYVDIENSALRSNGHLLFTTLTNPQLYSLDPSAAEPVAEVVDWLPGVTALTGIVEVGEDIFAVIGGVRGSYNYTQETIFTVDFSGATDANPNATVVSTVATLPDAVMLNGMAALPSNPHILVIADSRLGCLWRVDIDSGAVAKAIADPLLNATAGATVPIGVDGLKISPDGAYAYVTNVNLLFLGRIPIADNGTALVATGDLEVVTYFETEDDWDDFVINGTIAYGAQSPNYFSQVDLETGELTVLVNDTAMDGPTSITLNEDRTSAYLTTRGASPVSGQVFEITF